jgi:hypothetical protein
MGIVGPRIKLTIIFIALAIAGANSARAQQIPQYDVERHCNKIASFGGDYSATLNNACMRQEQSAYDALKMGWGSYPSQVLDHCDRIASFGGDGSYTLL